MDQVALVLQDSINGIGDIPADLAHPQPIGFRCDACDLNLARLQFYEEQHHESLQPSNTIVVFTSDNGGERFSDTWPFTGKKTELLEGGLRIPAIVRWPGRIKPKSTTEQVAMTMDWLPTLTAAADTQADPAYPSDGISLLAALTGSCGAGATPRNPVCWRCTGRMHKQAARDGDMKYLKLNDNTFLFNVVEDPLERANLKNHQPDVYQRLVDDYNEWETTMLPALGPGGGNPRRFSREPTGGSL